MLRMVEPREDDDAFRLRASLRDQSCEASEKDTAVLSHELVS
jgi:hypothetical protein